MASKDQIVATAIKLLQDQPHGFRYTQLHRASRMAVGELRLLKRGARARPKCHPRSRYLCTDSPGVPTRMVQLGAWGKMPKLSKLAGRPKQRVARRGARLARCIGSASSDSQTKWSARWTFTKWTFTS